MNLRFLTNRRFRLALLTLILSTLASYSGQPLIHGNKDAIEVIVTVYSILAGFLVAIITILGDPALLPPGSWRAAELERERLIRRIRRHKWLFIAYLVTLGLVFVSLLASKAKPEYCKYLEYGFLFLATFSFALSLRLPSALVKAQIERIDSVIEQRRKEANIGPNSDAINGEASIEDKTKQVR